MTFQTLQKVLVPTVAMLVFLILWEFIVWVAGWPNYKMASPSDLLPAFSKHWNLFLTMGWQTLWRTSALFSPMPAVNTMASTPPMTAA